MRKNQYIAPDVEIKNMVYLGRISVDGDNEDLIDGEDIFNQSF